ncbi:unnamed protein product [Zymoseptoria tritici ST99CH_1A5]|uniref:DH domain-containing protein n=3 Tax=Zymoseptoria tritici TaxID=1047171 RepID=A0A1X7RN58_ZYMT9|nr:unnamed protein product [Zymoseptoria tritici ST99CH_3D7]SMR48660.1 unnamed protein product [Zymoseptoria tritici ST99CH_1E4]SMR49844.1 unnamed protein product [Zymoseptoria tritici ST99CH_3D1]SMY22541.1 unnamed protein product [Zymoseptoria tritici ST99CH_1A5]
MSYYQGDRYTQPPAQQPPPAGYYDQYNQSQQQGQNGGYTGQQYGQQLESAQVPLPQRSHYGYPGQTTYSNPYPPAGSESVPQSHSGYVYRDEYQSPSSTSYGGRGYDVSPQQPAYNPQNYTQPPPPPPQQSSYNPAAYAYNQNTYQPQYNPAAYTEPSPSGISGGPIDPYAYSPGNYSSPSFSPQQQQQQQFAQHQQYSPQPPAHQYEPAIPQAHRYEPSLMQSPPPPPHASYDQQASAGAPQGVPVSSAPYPTETYPSYTGPTHAQQYQGDAATAMSGRLANDWRPSPPANSSYDTRQSPSPRFLASTQPSPPLASPGPTPPVHAPNRTNTLNRHPQERPLPPQPSQSSEYFEDRNDRPNSRYSPPPGVTQDDLYGEVFSMAMNTGGGSHRARSPSISITQAPHASSTHMSSHGSYRERRPSRNGTVNGHLSPVPHQVSHESYSSDSDAEAAQGLAMLRMAEEDDARRQSGAGQTRFSGMGSQRNSRQHEEPPESDSDDYANVDMSSFGGGCDVQMTYGGDPNQLAAGGEMNSDSYSGPISSQHSSMRRSHASQSSRDDVDYRSDYARFAQPYNPAARVEVGGTGGLSEPAAFNRRQSYDEGDEYSLMEPQLPERFPDEPPDIMFQHAASSYPSRPLPAVPYPEDPPFPMQTDFKALPSVPGQSPYPLAPDAYVVNSQGQLVPRSSSLVSHSNTPQIAQPLRSKTDAEERRLRLQQTRASAYPTGDTPVVPPGSMVLDLPAIGKRFTPSKLGAADFKKCEEPWSLKALLHWLLQVTSPEQNTELKEADILEALVSLFTNKVPTMNIADAEGLSHRVVQNMYSASTLISTEEWVKIVPGPFSGVIFQLTRSGCYSPTVHDHLIPNMRCYSHLCQRTLKKVNLRAQPSRSTESWVEYYRISKEDVEKRDKKEIEKQHILHEVVSTEERYMSDLDVVLTLYRDQLDRVQPSVITPKRKDKFILDVFGRLGTIKQANEEHLLPQLKYRQQEQGPWVVGYSDIFRQWIRKAKTAYVDYANFFPKADHLVRSEMDRNIEFRKFVESVRSDKRSGRLSLDSFLKTPITRLQRYTLLMSTILKTMKDDSQEKTNLVIALEEVKAVAMECDARVADSQRKIDLTDLGTKLVLRPGMKDDVELNLDHFGRELIYRGDVQRMGSNRFTWLDCHALLFDHYLILAKTVAARAGDGGKLDRYDVSRLPIPMDLLILESANDPAIQKSSYVKGITTVREATGGRTSTSSDPTLTRVATGTSSPAPSGLQHSNTGSSSNTLQPVTSLGDAKEDRIMYPFKVKHLGRETYTLFAPTENARRDWCNKIIIAKTKHAAALHAQNAEPFRLRVMADSAFVYDAFAGSGKGVTIKGTPVDRAIKEVEHRFKDTGRPGPICRARVNCAASFSTPYPGKQMVAVGTDYGVYVSELDNPRGWTKAIGMVRVTQVAVLEEFNLFLLISDKTLVAYHLDAICPNERTGTVSDSARKAPQKLSGSKDVGFFVTGKQKDRTLVFYKKRDNLNSVFKVLEPVYQKSSEKKRGMFKRGTTEFFREFDEFYIPTECTAMNLFHSSLAVSTARGFEVLTLDKKQPFSVPELKAEHVQNIAQHIKDQRALSMLRLSDQEFLLCYQNFAVYVNKHGDVSRSVIMQFVGSAQNAALYGPYLVLFDNDFVEIRNAQNGRLKQIIAGREVKCLDDGTNWSANAEPASTHGANGDHKVPTTASLTSSRTLKLVMQHPEMDKTQIVVELVLNENMKD